MHVGLCISGSPPFAVNQRAVAHAEKLGADSVWIADHMLGVNHPALWPEMAMAAVVDDPDAYYDPWCTLAALAPTTSLPLGMCVTDTTRRGAADLARTAVTLDLLAPGGFTLGVGAGEAENLLPYGLPFDRPVARTEQVLGELRALLDTGAMPTPHRGRLGLDPGPDGPPQVWVAGHGPRMLELTGRFADGWIPAWPMPPATYGERRRAVAAHAEDAGRPAPTSGLYCMVLLAESREEAARRLDAEPLAKLFALIGDAALWRAHGLEHPSGPRSRGLVDLVVHDLDPDHLRALAPQIPFALLEQVAFIGDATEVGDRLAAYAAEGLEAVVLANVTGMVGGVDELRARAGDLAALRDRLSDL